ncbi:MAG: hypothetical protein J6S56_03555 [Bacteroidales bacterium]|nr:hypothetical protein [Bacteroidales bacterium]
MYIIQYIALAAVLFCICGLLTFFIKIVRLGKPKDLSEKSGDVAAGVVYANTKAMMPQNKESAFLHLPEYAAGMLFHIGSFMSLLVFVLSFFPFFNNWICGPDKIHYLIALFPLAGCICGYILLLRRYLTAEMRSWSNIDDYLANFLTSTFQLMTLLFLIWPAYRAIVILYYVACILLFCYMPFGKLRHVVYYFAARYHLGFFYGWRNVWPPKE